MFYLPGAIYLYEETDLADIHGAGVRDDIDGKGFRVGIVVSRFNSEICTALLNACVDQLKASDRCQWPLHLSPGTGIECHRHKTETCYQSRHQYWP